ncbi:GNAT family N-acetyltransferase [Inhella gelatinilytica]|uniref:GNAT family N-acetyltransferase n=1 Tax=Inhella gelatinilytica TaxID=2795030 RepID=A0A931IXV5_9BURK|nr:GNAT family N-acetyltransferase [Inhella gelatinilytica]MBH9553064.1 GNAT family N-acetyltransferase [Inhella gelatinilytica]
MSIELHIELTDPDGAEAQALLAQLGATLATITGSSGAASFDAEDVRVARAGFALGRAGNGVAVACGALRPLEPGVAELKRMFAAPGTKGAGAALLAFLERKATAWGYEQIWLETRRVNTRAIAFYERHGYRVIPNFGRYVGRPEAVCLGKRLPPLIRSHRDVWRTTA